MIGFVNGEKLLTESDLPPQWNLLTGTADFSGSWINFQKTGSETLNGTKTAYYGNKQWNGIAPTIHINRGFYTFSLQIKALSTIYGNTNFYINVLGTSKSAQLASTYASLINGNGVDTKVSGNDWKKYSVTFECIQEGFISPRIETSSASNSFLLSQFKLEKGTFATTWMPAISDLTLKSY